MKKLETIQVKSRAVMSHQYEVQPQERLKTYVGMIVDIESGFSTINTTLLSDKTVVKLH